MNADELHEAIRSDARTELSRLGSSKSVYALTGGEMDGDAVRQAAAAELRQAAEVVAGWSAESDEEAAATFDAAAKRARAGLDRVNGDAHDEPETTSAVYSHLDGLGETAARAGGLLGWALVADAVFGQFVAFFVGRGDRDAAALFRELREEIETDRAAAAELAAAVCGRSDDPDAAWGRARNAGVEAIEAAYGDYVDSLESMGVEPKSVC